MAVLPGMEELANLLYVVYYQDEGKYDVIIMDSAPTGETLRLLSLPLLHSRSHQGFSVMVNRVGNPELLQYAIQCCRET